ncbi:MAG TPA: hypothetical protein VK487_07105 [Candidatus Bathyarchaeia archaeon]|nr:hypothetical protein [Candidatus Bathyarchaeia archaeon]
MPITFLLVGIYLGIDVARGRILGQVLPGVLQKHSTVTCYYCGRGVRTEEAVVRDDIVMCQKCAEDHPLTKDVKKDKTS